MNFSYYYNLFIILSLICSSSLILSYLLSFMFALCFLLASDLIILLISSICSSNEKVCSNVLYSVNRFRITFVIIIYFLLLFLFFFEAQGIWFFWCPGSLQIIIFFLINEREECIFVNFGVLTSLWYIYFFVFMKGTNLFY